MLPTIKIQEFDFLIEYQKGEELAFQDALSRLYECKNEIIGVERCQETKSQGDKIRSGKWNKHFMCKKGKGFGDLIVVK